MEQIATTEQAALTRAEFVVVLETLRDILTKIDAGESDRRCVAFGEMANDLMQGKKRPSRPGWLWSVIDQARDDAGDGERPAVVLVEVSQGRKSKRLVVLEWEV